MDPLSPKLTADAAAATSAALASMTWITNLNIILQLVATIVAIVAGIGAAWWHFERIYRLRHESKADVRDSKDNSD